MRAKILIFFYKCYKCFGKRGEVTLKMSRCFFVYVTKVRIKSDKQKNVAKLLADRRFRKMA
ncbi:unknown [Bacteroides sp. CAG:443]|nr:unknown [Bacteroides sp. CAG:443]